MAIRVKRGRYYPVLYTGKHPTTGHDVYKWFTGFATKKEAEREERRLRVELDSGSLPQSSKETVAEFLRHWLDYKRTDGTALRTLEGYVDIIEKRWIPAVGHLKMTELVKNPKHILNAQSDWFTN